MRIVIALGGNALLRRDQAPSADNQLANVRGAAKQLARIALQHELVITHGNGPQVGLLALQAAAYHEVDAYPLDVLGAQTEGMIGYLLEQELTNLLPANRAVASLLTRVQVDRHDRAFQYPGKPIGPVYTEAESIALAADKHWVMARDGEHYRRVVASPSPQKVLGLYAIRCLLERGVLVIAAGGGGIPVATCEDGRSYAGVEAVIDKDLCSSLLARELAADCLLIATDVDAVYVDWGRPSQHRIEQISPQALSSYVFPAGSMGPKVAAACAFALATGKRAVIGSLDQIEAMLAGTTGTEVSP